MDKTRDFKEIIKKIENMSDEEINRRFDEAIKNRKDSTDSDFNIILPKITTSQK